MDWREYFRNAWHVTGAALIGAYGVYAAAVQCEFMYGMISLLTVVLALSLVRMEYQNIIASE